MSEIILDQFGVTERKGVPVVSSRKVAEIFEKRHDRVLRAIEIVTNGLPNIGESEFAKSNFQMSFYKDSQGKRQPEVLMNRDGFSLVAMGFTGEKAMKFKVEYIRRFSEMESFITSLVQTKLEHPAWTSAIMDAHEEPKHYHFANEADMINRIVLGLSAKQFKEAHGLSSEVGSIRPHLTGRQIKGIEALQRTDIGLLVSGMDYPTRKQTLTDYFARISEIKLLKGG